MSGDNFTSSGLNMHTEISHAHHAVSNLPEGLYISNDPGVGFLDVSSYLMRLVRANQAMMRAMRAMYDEMGTMSESISYIGGDAYEIRMEFQTLREDADNIMEQVERVLKTQTGPQGKPGQKGDRGEQGPPGPMLDITTHPLYLEQVERIKDLQDRVEELAEAIDELEDN